MEAQAGQEVGEQLGDDQPGEGAQDAAEAAAQTADLCGEALWKFKNNCTVKCTLKFWVRQLFSVVHI